MSAFFAQSSDIFFFSFPLIKRTQGVKYLEQDVLPMRRQTESAVTKFLDRLVDAELTKAERLQIVNLAPQSLVELVVVSATCWQYLSPSAEQRLQ